MEGHDIQIIKVPNKYRTVKLKNDLLMFIFNFVVYKEEDFELKWKKVFGILKDWRSGNLLK